MLSEATALLLRVSRAAHLARALTLARTLRASSAAATSSGGAGGVNAGAALLGELGVMSDQLAALLCTARAHVHRASGEGGDG